MKKHILGITCALALTGSLAHAQSATSTTSTTTDNGVSRTTETTTTEGTGTITEYTPGSATVLYTGLGEPVHCRFGKSVTSVTPDGKVVEASRARRDSRARPHHARYGNGMMIDKVIVMGE